MSIKIALAGNPNCGKTTLFNQLTGSNQYVGNWPGVTVEKKEGKLKSDKAVIIQDLPGIYSLSPYTLEEVVSRNYLINEKPDAILNIVDGSNIERNLYLTTQLIEIGIPVVIAINMMDVVNKRGDKINTKKLSEELGCPITTISALKGDGCREAGVMAAEAARASSQRELPHVFSGATEHSIAHIEEVISGSVSQKNLRWYAIKLFEKDEKVMEQLKLSSDSMSRIQSIVSDCEEELGDDSESIVTNERYSYISKLITVSVKKKKEKGSLSISDKIDRIVTNRILALPIFALVMALVYYVSVTSVGTIVTDWTNDVLFGDIIPPAIESLLTSIGCADWLSGLILDGIVAGVGAVLGFVPQMLVLFIFLAFLEGCGYMARVAFILDRIFRRFGLSGKSFIPVLIGTGCGVPGIMASRTIENERDRRMTIMTTTFIPCGAKLPIIALIAGAMFNEGWWVSVASYFIGMAAIILSGIILKKTKMFSGDPAPFVMELPSYHMPTVGSVLRSMWERGWSFIKKAGTIILLSTIVVWFLSYFGVVDGSLKMLDDSQLDLSLLAKLGTTFAFIFIPLGFGSWKAAVATITGLVAKENVVGTFGILYGFTELADEEAGSDFWANLAADFSNSASVPAAAGVAAFTFLVFNLLCAPCFAAMGAIKREMNSGKWFAFAIGYQTLFAYLVSLCVYQFGSLFAGGGFTVGTVVSIIVLAMFLYLIFRTNKYEDSRLKTVPIKKDKVTTH